MNITVYCGALDGADPEYVIKARELGRWIAENGHTLVYGAGNAGMMGAVSDGVLSMGGKVIGVSTQFFIDAGVTRDDLTEMIVTEDMPERRVIMMDRADAFIALPGGTGTLDEISEVIAQKRLGRLANHIKPIMLYNVNGYYDKLFDFFDDMAASDFYRSEDRDSIIEVLNVQDIGKALERAGETDDTRVQLFG